MSNEIREPLPNQRVNIEVVYAGGTISSFATPGGYREGGHVVDLVGKLQEKIPDFGKRFALGQTQVAYTGLSENIDENYWEGIEAATTHALDRNPRAVLITHGTDSMEQTAKRLQRKLKDILQSKNAKVVLTGANDDLSHPTTDAWDNLTFALKSAQSEAEPGVYVAFHNRLIPADLVVKEPYNGSEMNYVSSADKEYTDRLAKLEAQDNATISRLEQAVGEPVDPMSAIEYPVNIVRLNNQELLDQINDNVKAVLLVLYHSGTANTENPNLSVADLVRHLRQERNMLFFGVTENGEVVDLHSYETSVKLREAGVIPLYNMRETIALAKLKLLAGRHSGSELIDLMLKNMVGEIDESKVIIGDIDKLKELYNAKSL